MKTSVAIVVVSLVVGALVAPAVVAQGPEGSTPVSTQEVVRSYPPAAGAPARRGEALQPKHSTSRADTAHAWINIPRLHLKVKIGTDLKQGPAWWPVTGRPGGGDTIAVAGHRTTYTRPFYWLERVQPGDSIYIRWQGRVHVYRMSGRRVLSAKNLHIADARGHELLLLSACTPRGSARQRLVVYAWPEE